MRRALGEQAFVVVESALAPTSVGVVAGRGRQNRAVVDPLFIFVAREINQALAIVHDRQV